jgi:ribosomal subunit interface protein
MDHSDAVEQAIREKAKKLEHYFSGMTSCKVVVEAPHKTPDSNPKPYTVKIEVGLPKHPSIVATRENGNNHDHDDINIAIRDAFDAAGRQLRHHAQKIKSHGR